MIDLYNLAAIVMILVVLHYLFVRYLGVMKRKPIKRKPPQETHHIYAATPEEIELVRARTRLEDELAEVAKPQIFTRRIPLEGTVHYVIQKDHTQYTERERHKIAIQQKIQDINDRLMELKLENYRQRGKQ